MITTIYAPRINTNDDKIEVVEWHIEPFGFVEAGQDLVDIETSKAVITVTSEISGHIRPLIDKGTVVRVGDPLYVCASTLQELESASKQTSEVLNEPATLKPLVDPEFGSTRFSKAAAQLLKDQGRSPEEFRGAGLVTVNRLNKKAGGGLGKQVPEHAKAPAFGGEVILSGPPTPRSERVTLAKKAEIEHLSTGEYGNINSKLSVYFNSAAIRERLLREQAFDGNIQPLILFELSRLLKKWPQFTAYYENDSVHFYDRVDLGVAFDLGKGLKVVSIKDSGCLMPVEFFERTVDIGLRYLENKIRPEELEGSTITITDLSGFNVLHFHPLINGKQSAIIGIGGDSAQSGHPMSLNMTFDHRVSNGREAAIFLGELRARLLNYAPAPEEYSGEAYQPPGPQRPEMPHANVQCDTCGIDLGTYYRDFGRDAYMLAYFREDGALGSVCHRCYEGM